MSERLQARVAGRLSALREAGLYRRLRPLEGIDLSSNDYLKLSQHPRVREQLIEAVRREGCGSTGSRLLTGERDAFAAVEQTFARFKGTERALYFSSGYLANLAVLTTFLEEGDVIFSDARNHASLIDAVRLSRARRVVFPHSDADMLARLMREHRSSGQAFIVTESLYSMDGDEAPLAAYASIARSTGAALIVDEAHAVGVCGARGTGLIEGAGIETDVCVSVNTAGKALGVCGAFVAGPSWAIEYLIQRARPFIFSTAPLPAVAAAIEVSLAIVTAEPGLRDRLRQLALCLRTRLAAAGIEVPDGSSQIVPVVIGDNRQAISVAERLQAEGFDVRAVRPPAVPAGTARLRIAANVGLDEATIDRFVSALAAAIPEATRCSVVSS